MDFRKSQKRPERPIQPPEGRGAPRVGAVSLESIQAPAGSQKKPWYTRSLIFVAIIVVLGLVAWYVLNRPAAPRADRYQVVFLDDNQVFFGKLKNSSGEYMRLEQVYSTQGNSSDDQDASSVASGDISLVKVGNLVYGPEDVMMIRADKVKFWQDLKSDSKISQTIDSQQ